MERHTALCALGLYLTTFITCDVDTSRQTPVSPHRTSSLTSLPAAPSPPSPQCTSPPQCSVLLRRAAFESHSILAHHQTQGMLLTVSSPTKTSAGHNVSPRHLPRSPLPAAFAPRSPPLLLFSPSPYKTVPPAPAPAASLSSRRNGRLVDSRTHLSGGASSSCPSCA
ncbi:hypothetical protein K438DRAFT_2016816 [Mycena galopus ATCC 62051]|nr:hypothetical protein K438DRAFT_2016816 [Mycena galopus ATCC 62051]